MNNYFKESWWTMKRTTILSLTLLSVLVAFIAGLLVNNHLNSGGSQVHAATLSATSDDYKYYILKDPRKGFVLARAPKGANGQPLSAPQPLVSLGNSFGMLESDSISSMQLSPDKKFLEINGMQDHGDTSWIFNTQSLTLVVAPAHVEGNFLHWIPGGNGHTFLYRPMFPLDPQAPMDGGTWNPGLWTVDAATAQHININIGMPSVYLADAAASPDGSKVIYSTTLGLGAGSDTWLVNIDGSSRKLLFHSAGSGQSIAGLFTWSPDGTKIAYERIADNSTPFQVAGLWIMSSDGSQQQRVGDADGGHGYAPTWSPDSQKVAFIVRTNTADPSADVQAQALQSGIQVVNVRNSSSKMVASIRQTGVQLNTNPTWSKDSNSLTFIAQNPINRVLGGSPRYYIAHVASSTGSISAFAQGQVQPLTTTLSHVVATN
jgi:WD40-like Beta Propeller Repeat